MNPAKKMLGVMLLGTCVVLLQNAAYPQANSKPAKAITKAQEQQLLQQLNEKLTKLDELTEKYNALEHRVDALQQQLVTRDAELEQARKDTAAAQADATETKRQLQATQAALGPNGDAVKTLQDDVAALKTTSSSLSTAVETTEKKTEKLENPDAIQFKGIELKPGGFLAGETVNRQRGTGSDVNTPFNAIPFTGTTAGVLSEFNASARQTRISLLAEGKLSSATLRGYYEADFLSAGITSNDNQSNSYTMRQRQMWGQAAFNSGWDVTFGQMWSLATEYRHGLANLSEAIPLTIDSQYNVGFTWERQYGFRAVKKIGQRLWVGSSVEEAQTLNIGGHNLPVIAYQESGTSSGLYNSTANYSFNYAPDVIAKIAYEPSWGHFEVFAIGRFFRDRVFPNGAPPPGAAQPPTTSALGAFTAKTQGGGAGINGRISIFDRKLDLGAHVLAGNGLGRYSSGTLPDATAHPNGALELLTGGSALGSLEYHGTPRFDLYAYYGGEYAKRAYYDTGYTDTTTGQPILGGYGAPTNNVAGCYVETLPSSGLASGPSSCNADNRNLQEGTMGYWFRFYKGTRGTFQQGIQYSYAVRHTWEGIGPITGLGFSPKAIDNMWFTSFRYYLP
jgi:cell division protein FtsB